MDENEWQPVRIAPMENWHDQLSRESHWATQVVGEIVRVKTKAACSYNLGCDCALHELHPDDHAEFIKGHEGYKLDAAECQILAD